MPPRIRIDPFTAEGGGSPWLVRWRVLNEGERTVRLASAVQPHAQFRTDEVELGPLLRPGAAVEIALPVRFSEAPGGVVENPFLILRVREDETDWMVLARVRVTAGPRGEPVSGESVAVTVVPQDE